LRDNGAAFRRAPSRSPVLGVKGERSAAVNRDSQGNRGDQIRSILGDLMSNSNLPNPAQGKQITIVVNGRQKTVTKEKASFDDVVALAFGAVDFDKFVYTVTYFKNEKEKHEGSLVQGQSIELTDGMIFTVVPTTKS
jgi:hypothetical protein